MGLLWGRYMCTSALASCHTDPMRARTRSRKKRWFECTFLAKFAGSTGALITEQPAVSLISNLPSHLCIRVDLSSSNDGSTSDREIGKKGRCLVTHPGLLAHVDATCVRYAHMHREEEGERWSAELVLLGSWSRLLVIIRELQSGGRLCQGTIHFWRAIILSVQNCKL